MEVENKLRNKSKLTVPCCVHINIMSKNFRSAENNQDKTKQLPIVISFDNGVLWKQKWGKTSCMTAKSSKHHWRANLVPLISNNAYAYFNLRYVHFEETAHIVKSQWQLFSSRLKITSSPDPSWPCSIDKSSVLVLSPYF